MRWAEGLIAVDWGTTNRRGYRLGPDGALLDELEDEREREALERLGEPGRGSTGLLDTLQALNERRVEALLVAGGYEAAGTFCPRCGWLGPEGLGRCPADGTDLVRRDDIVEPAIELALQQSADVLPLRRRDGELQAHGGIAALLRF